MLIDTKHSTECLPPSLNISKQQQSSRWFTKPLDLLTECRNTLGSSFTIDINNIGVNAFFCEPEYVSSILKADPRLFYSSEDKAFFEPITGKFSLFMLQGEDHLSRRRLLAPPFHHSKIKMYGDTITKITLLSIASWDKNNEIAILDELLNISLQITFKVVFGLNDDIRSHEIKSLIESLVKINRSGAIFFDNSINPAVVKLKEKFDKIKHELDWRLIDIINEKKQQSLSQDYSVLSLLVGIKDENNEFLSSEEIKDHLITMLIAGHETTGTAIAWAIHWIHRNPLIKERLLQDMSSASVENIDEQNYLHAVCQETLRIVPIISIISRTLKERVQIGNFILPKNINVAVPIFLLHQDASVFSEPNIFNPDRFLNRKYDFYQYMPFGGGSRICIGMIFALYQMKIVLMTLLKNVDMKLLSNSDATPVRKGIVIAPAEGVKVSIN